MVKSADVKNYCPMLKIKTVMFKVQITTIEDDKFNKEISKRRTKGKIKRN